MKKFVSTLVSNLAIVAMLYAQSTNNRMESIFDRIIYIEPKLIKEVPNSQRLCDVLPLNKQYINISECKLYVEVEGNGIPLVLINGGPGGTHHGFHPWFSKAKKYAKVIYYDQRGCGLSDYFPGVNGYSVEQATDDLEAIRKTLNIDKWVVLGFSYGGFLAQYYTLRYPERVSGLVLLGASPGLWTSLGDSRQMNFISIEEKRRIREISLELNELFKAEKISEFDFVKLQVFNNYLNGDWKRQHFYKPSIERMSQIARYEWVHDNDFNRIMNKSANIIDLTGAFKANPIPTLILEGKWDLTWSEQKKEILKANHPNSRMEIFENAGHSIYDEEPDKFFSILNDFITSLKPINDSEIKSFKDNIVEWDKLRRTRPDYKIRTVGWGIISSKKLMSTYKREDLDQLNYSIQYLRLGFAQYDMKQYDEALFIFEQIPNKFESDVLTKYIAIIWQGHILDLLGKRDLAIQKYKIIAELNSNETVQHSQYGLSYELSSYAKKRIETPFTRIENQSAE